MTRAAGLVLTLVLAGCGSDAAAPEVTRGPHRRCAAPPLLPPPEAAGLRRFAVQPRDADGCLDWWTVDAFLDDDGRLRVVTLDLWEP